MWVLHGDKSLCFRLVWAWLHFVLFGLFPNLLCGRLSTGTGFSQRLWSLCPWRSSKGVVLGNLLEQEGWVRQILEVDSVILHLCDSVILWLRSRRSRFSEKIVSFPSIFFATQEDAKHYLQISRHTIQSAVRPKPLGSAILAIRPLPASPDSPIALKLFLKSWLQCDPHPFQET